MIRAHKVLAAYACLAPRLAAGRFDPTAPARRVALDGQLLPRRRRHLAHPGLPRRRRAARRHEPGALRLARRTGSTAPEDIVRTPGTESNVKEIYDKCAELARDPANEIVNQFSEFGNYLAHWRCTGPALEAIFLALREDIARTRASPASSRPAARPARSAAGDYLKAQHGTKIAVVEAVECPTLLNNGYGEHNIQGIGDKHVPLIHNVMNTDLVIGISRPGDRRPQRRVQHRGRARLPGPPPRPARRDRARALPTSACPRSPTSWAPSRWPSTRGSAPTTSSSPSPPTATRCTAASSRATCSAATTSAT